MKSSLLLFLALLALAIPEMTSGAPRVVRFSGEVRQGQRFERAIGGGLRFQVAPLRGDPTGFAIRMVEADSAADYVAIATPPYHGVNAAVIEAWHFRNADNTGANQGDVNAPQEEREVRFVTRRRDYDRFKQALNLVLWPNGASPGAVDTATAAMNLIPCGDGELRIRDLQLGNLGKGLDPVIERMRFDVKLTLPSTVSSRTR